MSGNEVVDGGGECRILPLGDGEYQLGGLDVDVRSGKPTLKGTDTLAGSTLTLDRAVEVVTAAGVDNRDAVAAASTVPAGMLGDRV